jgi:hypothetical protein
MQIITLGKHLAWLFMSFIFACGITHALGALKATPLLTPLYELFQLTSLCCTAIISLGTGIYLHINGRAISNLICRIEVLPRGRAQSLASESAAFKEVYDQLSQESLNVLKQALLDCMRTNKDIVCALEVNTRLVMESKDEQAKKNRALETMLKLVIAEEWHTRTGNVHRGTLSMPSVPGTRPASGANA